jgi:hypothetical protein
MRTGTTAEPFWNFQLAAVRRLLTGAGFLVRVGASVNNLRRWDRRLAPWLASALRPAVDLAEVVAQRAGAGWWGPNQFVLAERPHPLVADVAGAPWPGSPAIAALMCCPRCRGRLSWTAGTAVCHRCRRRYERTDGFWDFTVDAPVMALSTAG